MLSAAVALYTGRDVVRGLLGADYDRRRPAGAGLGLDGWRAALERAGELGGDGLGRLAPAEL